MKRSLGAGIAILVAWTLVDALTHRLFLAPIYEASSNLWRPFNEMNAALIYTVVVLLVGVFVGTYSLLVRPKSLGNGLVLGALIGLALGISSGFGTFIHMPIPLSLAWGWFFSGWLKGVVAGGILGAVIADQIQPLFPNEEGTYENPDVIVAGGEVPDLPQNVTCPGSLVIYSSWAEVVPNCTGFAGPGAGNNAVLDRALQNAMAVAAQIPCADDCPKHVAEIWRGWRCGGNPQPIVAIGAVEVKIECGIEE